MNEQQRRELVEKPHDFYIFRGRRATVAGWAARCSATVTTSAPGFFHATWAEIQRAADADGVIENAIWVGGGWLECEAPENKETT